MKKQLLLLICMFIGVFVLAQSQPFLQWQQLYGGTQADSASCIIQTADGGYIVGGTTSSNTREVTGTHGRHDIWIVKLTPDGVIQWQKALGGSNDDYFGKLVQTNDGGYIIAGTTWSKDKEVSGNHGYSDAWIVKLNANGIIKWAKTYGSSKPDGANSIVQTSDGGYIFTGICGANNGDVSGYHAGADVWVVKLNNSGVIKWQKSYGGSNDEQGNAVKQTSDTGYIVAATTKSNDGDVTGLHGSTGSDYWILKLDKSGNLTWQKTYGGSRDELSTDVIQTSHGGYVVAGCSNSNNGNVTNHHGDAFHNDIWIIKLFADGRLNWQESLGWNNNDYAAQVAQMNDGSIAVGGWTDDTSNIVSDSYRPAFLLMNLKMNGEVNWQSLFAEDSSYAYSMAVTTDNGFVMAGKFGGSGGIGAGDYEVMKISPYALNTNVIISNAVAGNDCYTSNSITCTLSKSGTYKIQLYNYGMLYDSAVGVKGSFTFRNISEGTYYATAVNSVSSATSSVTSLLPSPSGVMVNSLTSSGAQLNWNKLDCADYFLIKYKVQRSNNWIYRKTNGNVINYMMSDLKPATTYIAKITAHKSTAYAELTSPFSDSIVFTTLDSNILFAEDFEAPDIDKNVWLKEAIDTDNAITTSTDVARKNKRSAKFSFDFKDWTDVDSLQPDGHRTELHPKKGTVPARFNLNTGYWIGLSNYFPSSWQLDPTPSIIWQFHGETNTDSLGGGSNQPALYASVNANKSFVNIQLIDTSGNVFSIGSIPIIKGQWNDWIMHVKFSYTSGFDTIWVNGKRVAAYAGSNFYHVPGQLTNLGPYFKVGIYKPSWGDPGITGQVSNCTMYDDAIIIGNNKATYKQISSYIGAAALPLNQTEPAAKDAVKQDAVASLLNVNDLMIYPNPATSNVSLQFNANKESKYTIQLHDITGRLLQIKKITATNGLNRVNFNVNNYAQGIYMITLMDADKNKRTLKFTKE